MDASSSGSDDDESVAIGPLYPKLTDEEQAMPNIRVDRTKPSGNVGKSRPEHEGLIQNTTSTGGQESQPKWRKMVPAFLQRNSARTESEKRAVREKGFENVF